MPTTNKFNGDRMIAQIFFSYFRGLELEDSAVPEIASWWKEQRKLSDNVTGISITFIRPSK